MIQFDKWVFPDGEEHLQGWMSQVNRRIDGRLTYQFGKYETCLEYIKDFRLALDIGAHVGLWSWLMAKNFKLVSGFEPMPEHQECWYKNMTGLDNVELHHVALGDHVGKISLSRRTANSSGDTQVEESGIGDINLQMLDQYGLVDVDFIKVDCEGYELNVLKGAEKTLLTNKPCVIVEQKGFANKYGHEKLAAVDYLKSIGAKLRHEVSGDYILSWDK